MVWDFFANNAEYSYGNATPGSEQDFAITVGDRVFFSLDSSVIEADAQRILVRQAEWLLLYPHHTIMIEGHADDRGTREYNLALGQRRAIAVRDYLVSLGVSPQRMKTMSYGKERPVAVCDDISCWNQNRRVVISITSGAVRKGFCQKSIFPIEKESFIAEKRAGRVNCLRA
uniref:18.5 kDa protein n=1 Tax=Bartonella bacilliformis TaxID=774 RepID=Q45017_BARBA|nr:18.5 kDa protein [Bartonella bacilliformis]